MAAICALLTTTTNGFQTEIPPASLPSHILELNDGSQVQGSLRSVDQHGCRFTGYLAENPVSLATYGVFDLRTPTRRIQPFRFLDLEFE